MGVSGVSEDKESCDVRELSKITVIKNEWNKATNQQWIDFCAKERVSLNIWRQDEPGDHSTW